MQKVTVVSKKYDGTLREAYDTNLYSENADEIILFSPPGTPYWDYRGGVKRPAQAPDGLVEIYFKRRWYNLWHVAVQNSGTNHTYINIALPAVLRDGILEWVDLDLDYRVHLDHSIERLDEQEFKVNKQYYGYPPELLEQVEAACREVEDGLAQQTAPFDRGRYVALYQQVVSAMGGRDF